MKRGLYIGLVASGTLIGWLLLIRPVGAGGSDRAIAGLPTPLRGQMPAAIWTHPRLPSVLNGVLPSEAERFFRDGRQQGDREIQRLLQPQRDKPPILTVSPDVPVLPDDRTPRDRP